MSILRTTGGKCRRKIKTGKESVKCVKTSTGNTKTPHNGSQNSNPLSDNSTTSKGVTTMCVDQDLPPGIFLYGPSYEGPYRTNKENRPWSTRKRNKGPTDSIPLNHPVRRSQTPTPNHFTLPEIARTMILPRRHE